MEIFGKEMKKTNKHMASEKFFCRLSTILCLSSREGIIVRVIVLIGLPKALVAKNLPPMQEMQEIRVQSLGGEDCLEKEMVPHSSILAWKIPWTKEPGGL